MSEPIFKFAIREDLKDNKFDFLPTRATARSAGWDVRAALHSQYVEISPGEMIKIPLGFRAFCPEGWWFELRPRSSTFAKKNMHCLYGVIDTDYEGEVILAAQWIPNYGKSPYFMRIDFGDALGQIIPVKRQDMIIESITNKEYDALCENRSAERGAGGFGSTNGKNND